MLAVTNNEEIKRSSIMNFIITASKLPNQISFLNMLSEAFAVQTKIMLTQVCGDFFYLF